MWGGIELEPEAEEWLRLLTTKGFAQAAASIDLLEDEGVLLGFPHSSRLDGKLRELRFYIEGEPTRISYFIAPVRRIILLTVFKKTQRQESAEIARARRAMAKCIRERHIVEED